MKGPSPTAAIVLVGDELLSGKVRDENGFFLLRSLRSQGVMVSEICIIPDCEAQIAEALLRVRERNDLVIVSGGVGPTHDDRTMAGVARAWGVELVCNHTLMEMILGHWGTHAAGWKKVAMLPQGCELIDAQLSWPIFKMANCYILPGTPRFLQEQFAALSEQWRGPEIHLEVLTLQSDEGLLAAVLTEATERFPAVSIGSYPQADLHTVRITIESVQEQAVVEATKWLQQRLCEP